MSGENDVGAGDITSANDLKALKNRGLVLIDFSAPWCAPCSLQEPIIDRIADRFAGKAGVGKVNIDKHIDIASEFDIRFIPTLIIFKNQMEVQRLTGLQPEAVISEALEKFLK
jgi:thioredoxin 1